MALTPDQLRTLAFTGRSAELREYGRQVALAEPNRAYVNETLEIVAALADNEYTVAAAFIESTRYKYAGSEIAAFIDQVTGLYEIFIDFALGRLGEVRKKFDHVISLQPQKPGLEKTDRLILMKMLADTAFLFDDAEEIARITEIVEGFGLTGESTEALYFTHAIKVLHLFNQGDFKETLALAEKTIAIGKRAGFKGVAHDLSLQNVRMRCFVAMAKHEKAYEIAPEILAIAKSLNVWPWYFVTNGFIIKHLAQQNKMKEALLKNREDRDLIASFTFKNELNLFVDASELYVRYLLQDADRIEVLMERVPQILLTRQIKSEKQVANKDLGIKAIENLPERNARERIYKLIALSGFYIKQESVSMKYAREALALTEQTGYVQYLLLQNQLYPILLKACAIKATAFTEELANRLVEQMKMYDSQQKGALAEPLTVREREVIQHLATGKPITQIASTLHISMNTMKTHLRNAYRKLDVDGRHTAVTKARELFLI